MKLNIKANFPSLFSCLKVVLLKVGFLLALVLGTPLVAHAQKSIDDVGNVPNIGGGGTEAGVSLPGAGGSYYTYTPGATRNRPGMNTGNKKGTGYVPTDFSGGSGLLGAGNATALGFLNLFAQADAIRRRIPYVGTQKPFYGECKFCEARKTASTQIEPSTETAATATDETAVNDDGTPTLEATQNAHDPGLIRQLITKEDIGAFVGLDDAARTARINDVITSLDPYGALVFQNTDEYSAMCPNFENLNANQRKAFMVFLYSEVFKQTSAYEDNRRTTSTVDGASVARVGLCQISYPEYTQVRSLFAENFNRDGSVTKESFESEYAVNPLNNMTVCSALIFNRTENASAGSTPIKNMFPNVNFSPIEKKLKNLKLCKN